MKKLMTTLAAVATAFGLYAADTDFISGAAFDKADPTLTGAGTLTWKAAGGFNTTTYWKGIKDGVMTLNDTAADQPSAVQGLTHPKAWTEADGDQFVQIKTTLGEPVAQRVLDKDNGQPMGDNFYFDGLVNMTVFDEAPDFTDFDGKIAVWLQADESSTDDPNPYLYVKDGNDTYKITSYKGTDVTGWHRLTIKAIANITQTTGEKAGFVIFIDGNPVSSALSKAAINALGLTLNFNASKFNEGGNLFVAYGETYSDEIAEVAFDGQGGIDEILFTTEVPFSAAANKEGYMLSWDTKKIASITITGGETYTTSPASIAGSAPETITGTFVGKGDYCDGEFEVTPQTGKTIDIDVTPVLAVAYFGDEKCEDVDAVNRAAAAATASDTIKLIQNVTETITVNNENADVVITIDLNGHNVTAAGNAIDASTAVIITGTGVVDATGDEELTSVYGIATINGGTFEKALAGDLMNINGGAFKVKPTTDTITTVNIPDGKRFVEQEGYWVLADIDYVAQIGDNKYETLDAAWTAFVAAKVDATITVLMDAEIGCMKWNGSTANLTLDLGGHTLTAVATGSKYVFQFTEGNYTVTIKNGAIKTVAHEDGADTLATVFQNYANLVVEDVEIDAANFGTNKYSDKAGNIFAVMKGNVVIQGDTSIINNNGYALTIGNHSGNAYPQSARSVTLNTTGTLGGDFRFCGGKVTYTKCGFSEGAKFLYGSAWNKDTKATEATKCSVYEDGDLVGFPYVARVGKTPVLPTEADDCWYKYFGEFALTLDAAIAAATAGDEVAVFKNVTQDTVTIVSGTATTLAIGDEATLTVNTALTLNGAKVALAEGCALVVPAALDKTTDFVAPGAGKEIKVAGEGPFTYTVGDAAQPVLPGEPVVVDPAEADAKVAAMNDNKAAYLTAPAGVEFGEGEFANYAKLFTATANAEKTQIAFLLNADGEKAVADAEAAEKSPILAAIAAAEGDTASLTVTNPIKGFYYGLKEAGSLEAMKIDQVKLAGKDEVTFTLDKSGDAGFYEVVISPEVLTAEVTPE